MGYLVWFHNLTGQITITDCLAVSRWTRFLGTVAAAGDMSWRGYFWPERMSYVFSPYGIFLFWMSEIPDIAYAVVFWYIRKKEPSRGLNKAGKAK